MTNDELTFTKELLELCRISSRLKGENEQLKERVTYLETLLLHPKKKDENTTCEHNHRCRYSHGFF